MLLRWVQNRSMFQLEDGFGSCGIVWWGTRSLHARVWLWVSVEG